MTIAYITSNERGRTDRVLAEIAARLAAENVRLAGAVQRNSRAPGAGKHAMDLELLPMGDRLRISQDLGRKATGCRLDPGALEEAVGKVGAAMGGPVDLVILNKFGKHEAEGRGFRALLAEAAMAEIPVLIGVGGGEGIRDAFESFTGGLATPLPADIDAVLDWCRERLRQGGAAAE
ncbi:DUF2478 domain-containing protein [Acidimangrovimonas pyrenivorans]|uniref:DUF2478 domain-containing protein n=1 Tax=Acidimangrovimonas pyrenivorans TaxID=2030798 RepID=A0ABV7AGG5_9RHOB